MKQIQRCLATLLVVLLTLSAAFAEGMGDITLLMDAGDIPEVACIDKQTGYDGEPHEIACAITADGKSYGCEFSFASNAFADVDWSAVQSWLGDIILYAATNVGANTQALAKKIDEKIESSIKNAIPDESGSLPVWADGSIQLLSLSVSTPYYPKLSVGKKTESTRRLQQTLVRYGFLDGNADGDYGDKTRRAVQELQEYVDELVREAAQAGYVEELTSVTAAQATSALPAEPDEVAEDLLIGEVSPRYNGIADALLQSYLYSDNFTVIRGGLKSGARGIDVRRLQRRLNHLSCSADSIDGIYGMSTVRAVQIFQYYNKLPQTGVADVQTLERLYSDEALTPGTPLLALDDRGDEVKALQTRLYELGFSTTAADGIYGESTRKAVIALQQYMSDCGAPNIALNGVADPILLNDFFSPKFPVANAQVKSGDKGEAVMRIQRRLTGLKYFEGTIDGDYGKRTTEAVLSFQKQHKLGETGVCDAATQNKLFSDQAHKSMKPYMIRVSIAEQLVRVYALDDNCQYNELVREMKCSTGKRGNETPKGTYEATTGPGARWHFFKKFNCWAQYAYYIQGDIMFHSVIYNQKDGRATSSSVNALGRTASHGCVRLSVENAEWIWRNCPKNTKVIVE